MEEKEFKIDRKEVLILTRPKKSNNTNIHLEVIRNEYNDVIKGKLDRNLYDGIVKYVSHDGR